MEDPVDESGLCFNHPQEQAAGSVVYKLVRVEGDGTLVPATDDEVMEVEHMLKVDKKDPPSTEGLGQSQEYACNMGSPEGSLQSKNSEGNPGNLNARLEYLEVMLQKVKHEEKLRLLREAPIHSPKCNNLDRQSSDQQAYLPASNSAPRTESSSQETGATLVPIGLNERSVEQYTDFAETEQTASRALVTSIYSNSYPDFSLLEADICLDKFTIRELQETFRLTVGRQTSVKDKLWLKRRIAMELSNSCVAPSTGFIIKGRKIVLKNTKGGHYFSESTEDEVISLPTVQNIGSVKDKVQDFPATPMSQVERSVSGKRLRTSASENDSKSAKLYAEIIGAKRVRKPTKRYIEELSKVETRECYTQPVTPVKSSGQAQFSAKCRFRPTASVSPQHTAFITRMDFLGGCGVQVPYVLRVRRGRPRTNILALMNAALIQREKPMGERYRKEQASGDYLDDYSDIVLRPKCGTRRNHHRAWTLREVVKLVEGVSKYGAGRWSEIKRFAFPSYTYRTSVDLKDKWRNLLRACFTHGPTEKGVQSSARHASGVIPASILLRVKELAEMQFQEGIGFSSAKVSYYDRENLKAKRSGFL